MNRQGLMRVVNFGIIVAIALMLAFYTFTFTVPFDSVAVRTTFGRAGDNDIKTEPGLYFRAPPPFQSVTTYSRNMHLLESRLQQIQTRDGFSVIVKLAVHWRVDNARDFFVAMETEQRADTQLKRLVGSLTTVIAGEYDYANLVSADPDELKLDEISETMKQELSGQVNRNGYGILIEDVSVIRVILPENTSGTVFEDMIAEQQSLAAEAREAGEGQAALITSEAESVAQRIITFAELEASDIVNNARREAARYNEQFAQNPELAQLLKTMEFLRETLGNNTTFIFNAEQIGLDAVLNAIAADGTDSEEASE